MPGRPAEFSKKTAVFGMAQRGGDVITRVVPDAKGETLVAPGTLTSSDRYRVYRNLRKLGYRLRYLPRDILEPVIKSGIETGCIRGSHLA